MGYILKFQGGFFSTTGPLPETNIFKILKIGKGSQKETTLPKTNMSPEKGPS